MTLVFEMNFKSQLQLSPSIHIKVFVVSYQRTYLLLSQDKHPSRSHSVPSRQVLSCSFLLSVLVHLPFSITGRPCDADVVPFTVGHCDGQSHRLNTQTKKKNLKLKVCFLFTKPMSQYILEYRILLPFHKKTNLSPIPTVLGTITI